MWIVICAVGVVIALAGERYSNRLAGAAGKLAAATAYIAATLSMGAADTTYGQILLLGMAFCWIGDMLLVSNSNRNLFLLGLASFLLGHAAYIGAFATLGVSLPALLGAGLVMTAFAWVVLRWLGPHLDDRMRLPVWFYVIAICSMMSMAVGTFPLIGNKLIPLGATLFLLSDLAVARDRFIAPGFINRAWGLPVYFCGQMVLAFSVAQL
ncbi:lysoplasmalogenase [Pseudomonadota bacterium]